MMRFLRSFRCSHVWRYVGSGLCATFVPDWAFQCKKCRKTSWTPQGKFPDKESYQFYREKMGTDFKSYWKYFVDASLVGNYFVGVSLVLKEDEENE